MDVRELFRRAVQQFDQRLTAVPADRWSGPTPCAEWTVRDLVAHVVDEDRWCVPLLEGATIAEVGDRFSEDALGDDPVAAWDAAGTAAAAAVDAVELRRAVHLSYGDTDAESYLRELAADHLVHAWDLAVSVGADDALPADLVDACSRWFDAEEAAYREAGVIGPAADVAAGADAQTVLLARFGRARRWSPTSA